MALVVVRGSNDVGSAVAHCLYQVGHQVVIHDGVHPAHSRRGMAFTDAVFDGKTELGGVYAKLARQFSDLKVMLQGRRAIPVTVAEFSHLVEEIHPDVLVDARMRKRAQPEPQKGLVPLTIGLGPNFIAGDTTDVVIETAWGECLGQVIRQGASLPLAGEPRTLGGHQRERFVYAPVAGTFTTDLDIGAPVNAGEAMASIGTVSLVAPLTRRLRGITRNAVRVEAGAKVIEVDARADDAQVRGIGERPRRIAEGVLQTLTEALPLRDRSIARPPTKAFTVGALIGLLGGLTGVGGAFSLGDVTGYRS